jgi:N-acylneuraminate cytidylyltransferase
MKVLAIIPARGGSKGIPKKNITDVLGKPLIHWSIEAAIKSEFITDIVVSSDDDDILENVSKFNGIIKIKRPSDLAQDSSPTEPVLSHVLSELKKENKIFDILILLQPTSPLRNEHDIDAAFNVFLNCEATSLISVIEPEHHPLKSFVANKKGYLKGLVNDTFPFTPRQELPKVYQPNGAIYIVKVNSYLKSDKLFTEKTIPYLMSSEKSIDIDSLEDIKQLENQFKT